MKRFVLFAHRGLTCPGCPWSPVGQGRSFASLAFFHQVPSSTVDRGGGSRGDWRRVGDTEKVSSVPAKPGGSLQALGFRAESEELINLQ